MLIHNKKFVWLTILCFFISILVYSFTKSLTDTTRARAYFQSGEDLYKRNQFESALELYLQAADLYKKYDGWLMYATCLKQAGFTSRKLRDYDESIKYFNLAENSALTWFRDNSVFLMDLYYKKALTYLQFNKNKEAIEYFTKAIDQGRKNNKVNEDLLVKIYNNLGIALFNTGEYDKAIDNYKKSLFYSKMKNNVATISTLNNMGSIYHMYGLYDEAIKYFLKAIELNSGNKNPRELYINYLNIGNEYNAIGNYYEALDYNKQAYNYFKNLDFKEISLKIMNNIGAIYLGLNEYDLALEYSNKSMEVAKALNDSNTMAKIYNNLGVIYDDLKDYDKAIYYYNQSLNINKCLPYKSILGDLNNIGTAYNHKNQFDKALVYFQNSLKLAEVLDNKVDINCCYLNIAELYHDKKQYKKSLYYFQKGLNEIVPNFQDSDLYKNPQIKSSISDIVLLNTIERKANTFYLYYQTNTKNTKDIKYSLENYNLAIELIDLIRQRITTSDTKLFFAAKEKSTYSNSVDIAIELFNITKNNNYKERAFEYAEKGKATLLYELIREHEAKKYAGIPDSIIESEKNLKNKIAYYNKAIYEEKLNEQTNQEKLELWENKVFILNNKLRQITSTMEKNYPRYYKFKYENKIFKPEDIQKYLRKDYVLIEYFISENGLNTFLITPSKFKVTHTKIDSSFDSLIYKMQNCLSKSDFSKDAMKHYTEYVTSAYRLYQLLLLPLQNEIRGKHLIIVPDGALAYIPFEALITSPASIDRLDYKNLTYLIKSNSISYCYTSTLLINSLEIKNKKASFSLVAFAPFYNKKFKADKKIFARNSRQWTELDSIPDTKKEAKDIGKMTHGKVYLGEYATESGFKLNAPKYKVLHIATHGLIDDKNPMYSKLVFRHENDFTEDGSLNTYELFNMDLHADLAVLSACNTGRGKLQQGEGIMTIARGFLYAGVPSIIMSLWRVNDETSSNLMVGFYKYLKAHCKKDQALQKAKLEYLSKADNISANPYYWAGFVSIGDTKPIQFSNFKFLWILILLLPTGFVAFHLLKR